MIEVEARRGEELHRLLQVANRHVDEDLSGTLVCHGFSLSVCHVGLSSHREGIASRASTMPRPAVPRMLAVRLRSQVFSFSASPSLPASIFRGPYPAASPPSQSRRLARKHRICP